MGKLNLSKIVKDMQESISKHSPEILTGIGIAGMIGTTVLAVKATPKALDLIEEAEEAKIDNGDYKDLTIFEVIKVAWKPYIPAVVTGFTSVACLIGASSVNARRNAALATAYNLSKAALTEYKEKVVETIGENKERAIKDKIAKDKIDRDPVTTSEVFITEKGNTLCYDTISGRYFKSDIDKIKRAENMLNKILLRDMCVSLNEFYDELNLSHTSLGNELGWRLDDGMIDLYFSSQIADDGTPCLVVDYSIAPRYNYSSML